MTVTVLSGPAGVGKGTLVTALRRRHPEVWLSTSVTTRPRRPREVEGQHYHFISEDRFDELLAEDGLLEWALVHRVARYGTPRQPVLDAVARGCDVLLEIELQGARQIRQTMPEAHFVFIAPPSWQELVGRLERRGTETEADRARRLATAEAELAAADEFDDIVVNDDVSTAVDELIELMGLLPEQQPNPTIPSSNIEDTP